MVGVFWRYIRFFVVGRHIQGGNLISVPGRRDRMMFNVSRELRQVIEKFYINI